MTLGKNLTNRQVMSKQSNNPEIEWCQISDKECLKFTFQGTLTEINALDAIAQWKEMFSTRKDEKVIIIWQCLKMESYEPMARILWQNTLKELKNQIDTIWLVSDSIIIKAGAKIMSFFTTLNLKIVNSEEKITV